MTKHLSEHYKKRKQSTVRFFIFLGTTLAVYCGSYLLYQNYYDGNMEMWFSDVTFVVLSLIGLIALSAGGAFFLIVTRRKRQSNSSFLSRDNKS